MIQVLISQKPILFQVMVMEQVQMFLPGVQAGP